MPHLGPKAHSCRQTAYATPYFPNLGQFRRLESMNSDYIPALSPYFHVFAIAKNMKSVRQFWIGHRGRRSDIGPDRKRRSDFANAKLQPFKVGADCCTHCLLDRAWMITIADSSRRKSSRSPLRDFKDARRIGLAL